MRRIDDGMQLGDLIRDALEWSLPISHAVQDASKGPHITFRADLCNKITVTFSFTNNICNMLLKKKRSTFERAFPDWDDVSLMASGGI